ncbi:MAG: restriction endonuclease subunit S [Actinomycetota bacterium]|nr:restriction endonuclease subunit S [Actinomycetota bacterium]
MSDGAWKQVVLGDLIDLKYGRALRAGSRSDGEYPVIGSSGVVGKHHNHLIDGPALIVGRKGTVGAVTWSNAPCWPIDTTFWVQPTAVLSLRWLYWLLVSLDLGRYVITTGVPGLSRHHVYNVTVRLPPLNEQRKIAEIHDALDEKIRHSERAISKSHIVREAMMVDLLTRDNFCIQPMEALLAQGSDVIRSGPFGSELLASELQSSGIPLLGIDNVEEDRFVPQYSRFVSLAKFREIQRYKVRAMDIMVTIMGTVGRCCLVPEDIGLALSSKHVWTITLDQGKYRPWLASLQINYAPWVRKHFHRDSQGGIMSAIRSRTLRTLRLPTPPMKVQMTIEEVLRAQTELIARERETLDKLRLVKEGLMEDLLTGKVRVTRSGELTG